MTDPTPTAAPPVPATGRLSWVAFGATTMLGAALNGDCLRLAVLGHRAEVAHLVGLPPLWFWAPAAVLFLASLAVGALAMRGVLQARLSRVPLLIAVVLGFMDAFVLPDVRSSLPTLDVLIPVEQLGEAVQEMAKGGTLPSTVEELSPAVAGLGSPSLLVHGERPDHWALVVRTDCTAPIDSAPGTSGGTVLYCVSADRHRAWITAVALTDATFSHAEVARMHGQTLVQQVNGDAPPAP